MDHSVAPSAGPRSARRAEQDLARGFETPVNDVLSIPARRLLALLAPLSSDDEKTRRALAFLRGWDAREDAESPQAALVEVWQLRHLRKAYREAVLKPEARAHQCRADSQARQRVH